MKSVQINHRLCLSCFISWIFEVFFNFCRSPILDQLHYCSLLYYAHLSANQYSPVAYIIWFQRHAVRILGGPHGTGSLCIVGIQMVTYHSSHSTV